MDMHAKSPTFAIFATVVTEDRSEQPPRETKDGHVTPKIFILNHSSHARPKKDAKSDDTKKYNLGNRAK